MERVSLQMMDGSPHLAAERGLELECGTLVDRKGHEAALPSKARGYLGRDLPWRSRPGDLTVTTV